MSVKYQVVITSVSDEEEEVLTLRADTLHEIAPKLAALYPAPVVKRMHRRKEKETTP